MSDHVSAALQSAVGVMLATVVSDLLLVLGTTIAIAVAEGRLDLFFENSGCQFHSVVLLPVFDAPVFLSVEGWVLYEEVLVVIEVVVAEVVAEVN